MHHDSNRTQTTRATRRTVVVGDCILFVGATATLLLAVVVDAPPEMFGRVVGTGLTL